MPLFHAKLIVLTARTFIGLTIEVTMALSLLLVIFTLESCLCYLVQVGPWSLLLCAMSVGVLLLCLPHVASCTVRGLLVRTVLSCVVFFVGNSDFTMWVSFEVSTLPILYVVCVWGYQAELLLATYYLLGYSLLGGLSFLLIVSMSIGLESS